MQQDAARKENEKMEDLAKDLNENSFMGLEPEKTEFHRMYGYWSTIDVAHAALSLEKCNTKWFCSRLGGEYRLTLWRSGKEVKTFRYPDKYSVTEKILYGYVEGEDGSR